MVNPFYEIAACNAANYRFYHDWQELSSEQKEILVGHYFAGTLLENHKADAQNRASERPNKGRGKK